MARKFIHQVTEHGLGILGPTQSDTWRLAMTRPDGLMHLTVFPVSTPTWRIAEYGFDPNDLDTILDIIIHEQFMDFGLPDDLPTLSTAKHQQEAREAHIERIRRLKVNHTEVVPHGDSHREHPLQIIRNNHGITGQRIQECQALLMDMSTSHDSPKRMLPNSVLPPLDKNQESPKALVGNAQVIVSP